jgi:hypothetical protein
MSKQEITKVYVPNASLNYVALLEPKAGPNGGEPKFSVQMRLKKDTPETKAIMAKIKAAIDAAYEDGKATKWGGKNPDLKLCYGIIHDGDKKAAETQDESYKGFWILNANSKTKPGVIAKNGLDLTQPGHTEEIYSGMVATVSINFYAYSGAKKGIACGLNNVMKTEEGTYAGGRESAQSDFQDLIQEPAPASGDPSEDADPGQGSDPDQPF